MTTLASSPPDLILWDVVEEHFNEAEFLFGQWNRALHSPLYNLAELGRTSEQRLEAHLDGLVVAGPEAADRVLFPELENADEPARATVAALALLFSQKEETTARVIETAKHAKEPLAEALIRALVLANVEALDRILLSDFRQTQQATERAVLLEILNGRGVDLGAELAQCFQSDDPRLARAAVYAAGRFGRREMIGLTESHLQSDDPGLRERAMRASLILGSRKAWKLCLQLAESPDNRTPTLWLFIALLGQSADHRILYTQLDRSSSTEHILWTLGFCGTLQAGELCVGHLNSKDERVAKIAADSIAWIAGFNWKDPRFQIPATEPEERETLPALDEDALDADLGLDGVDGLPVPNRSAIAEWWKQNSGQWAPDQRYLLGRLYSPEALIHGLETGSLWRRHGLALELSIRTSGQQHLSIDAFSSQQYRQIEALSGIGARQWSRMEA